LAKTLENKDTQLEKKKHRRPWEMRMLNLKRGGETVLRGTDFKMGTGSSDSEFNPAALNM
jgi:hypothetical protein